MDQDDPDLTGAALQLQGAAESLLGTVLQVGGLFRTLLRLGPLGERPEDLPVIEMIVEVLRVEGVRSFGGADGLVERIAAAGCDFGRLLGHLGIKVVCRCCRSFKSAVASA